MLILLLDYNLAAAGFQHFIYRCCFLGGTRQIKVYIKPYKQIYFEPCYFNHLARLRKNAIKCLCTWAFMHIGVFTATSHLPRCVSAPTYGLKERKQMISAGLDDFNKIYCQHVRILAVALGKDVSSCEMSMQSRACPCELLSRIHAAIANTFILSHMLFIYVSIQKSLELCQR